MSKRYIQTKLNFSSCQSERVEDQRSSLKRKLSDRTVEKDMEDHLKSKKTEHNEGDQNSHSFISKKEVVLKSPQSRSLESEGLNNHDENMDVEPGRDSSMEKSSKSGEFKTSNLSASAGKRNHESSGSDQEGQDVEPGRDSSMEKSSKSGEFKTSNLSASSGKRNHESSGSDQEGQDVEPGRDSSMEKSSKSGEFKTSNLSASAGKRNHESSGSDQEGQDVEPGRDSSMEKSSKSGEFKTSNLSASAGKRNHESSGSDQEGQDGRGSPSDDKAAENDSNSDQSNSELSSDEEDDRAVKKNIEKDKPKVSDESSGFWKGVDIKNLKRAPACYREKNMKLQSLKPSREHKVLVEIPTEGFRDVPLKPFNRGSKDTWGDNDYVYMPYSNRSLMPQFPQKNRVTSRWEEILKALSRNIPGSFELEAAILSYNPHYRKSWNFDALHHFFESSIDGRKLKTYFFHKLLPKMQNLALRLPELCPKALPILKQRNHMKITLSQEQIACLLANAFFCTFPRRNTRPKFARLPDINFSNLFSDSHTPRKFEKFGCIFNYFQRVTDLMPNGTVTYTRQYVPEYELKSKLENSTFSSLHVSTAGTIEDDGWGMLQADFANKYVGGGVLGHGLVQEEIRFLICPEMILSRLFTEVLTDNEVLIMTGCERYSSYQGYSNTFMYSGNYEDTTERDEWGRRYTEVVAMDALVIREYKSQFEKDKVFRELQKAYCAFRGSDFSYNLPAVCTGNWGCGAFGGDKQLKALIQMMAASVAGRDICYFTFGDFTLCDQMGQIYEFLKEQKMRIKNILELIMEYHKNLERRKGEDESLFEYLAKLMGKKLKGVDADEDTPGEDYSASNSWESQNNEDRSENAPEPAAHGSDK